MGLRIGVDVGGTKIEIVAIDERGNTHVRRRVPTPAGDYAGTISVIGTLVAETEREVGRTLPVGIGHPGAISPRSGLVKSANSTVLIGKPFASDLESILRRSLRMANDANCLALSEVTDGAAVGARVVFAAILGTGVGGGLAFDGQVIAGPQAIAGEWGHNPLPWPRVDELPGPLCYCGKYGCIETFLSGPAFERDGRSRERYHDRLARALASIINVLDPDVIVLGGGLSNLQGLETAVTQLLGRYVFSDEVTTPVVRAAHGDSSGVRGAAMLWPAG